MLLSAPPPITFNEAEGDMPTHMTHSTHPDACVKTSSGGRPGRDEGLRF